MAWDYQRAKQRVEKADFANYEINIQPLSKSMDFNNLGTHDVRRVEGANLYFDVSNYSQLIESVGNDQQKIKKVIRAISVLRRLYTDQILPMHDAARIQMQGARLHAICYKPYDNESARLTLAVYAAVSLATYVKRVFNPLFEVLGPMKVRAGIDSGPFLIANIGRTGNRELICIGDSANIAAKILGDSDSIAITSQVYAQLPDALKKHFVSGGNKVGTEVFVAKGLTWCDAPDTAKDCKVEFDVDKLTKETESVRDSLPLDEIAYSDATERIDIDALSERNSKLVPSAICFADVDGFTQYIKKANSDDAIRSAIRVLHALRSELHAVTTVDNDGVVIQHQGDRLQSILHLPAGDSEQKRCRRVVDMAIGLQSSMEHVLNDHFQSTVELHLAIGIDHGRIMVTRVGKKGDKDVLCLGPQVIAAEISQSQATGKVIRIPELVYQHLADEIKAEFSKEGDSWVATNLTFPNLEKKRLDSAAEADTIGVNETHGRIGVVSRQRAQSQRATPGGPWLQ